MRVQSQKSSANANGGLAENLAGEAITSDCRPAVGNVESVRGLHGCEMPHRDRIASGSLAQFVQQAPTCNALHDRYFEAITLQTVN